jgi:hypothetical protein
MDCRRLEMNDEMNGGVIKTKRFTVSISTLDSPMDLVTVRHNKTGKTILITNMGKLIDCCHQIHAKELGFEHTRRIYD